jgi:hypothetical protein
MDCRTSKLVIDKLVEKKVWWYSLNLPKFFLFISFSYKP